MPGWPNKISRRSLGPTYQNAAKVNSPKEEADAAVFNLMCWQMAGMNGVVPLGIVIGQDDGSGNLTTLSQSFVWDPDGLLVPMVFTTVGPGSWTWALPGSGTYPDMNGASVPVQLKMADPQPGIDVFRNMSAVVDANGIEGSLYCFDAAGAPINIDVVPRNFLIRFY